MRKLRFVLISILTIAFGWNIQAQITISEYSASNLNQFEDNNLKFEDWIEVYNAGDMDMDISGWAISDKVAKPLKWQFPVGTNLPSKSYIIVWCSDRDTLIDGHYHTSFKLTQTNNNDTIVLSDPSGMVLESHLMELTLLGHSQAKNDNGEWTVSTAPTPGADNNPADLFVRYTQEPVIDRAAGYYADEQTVSISTTEQDVTLHYTTDGTAPTQSSPVYTNPILVTETAVVKARTFSTSPQILPGKIAFRTYFINETFTLPVFSVAADQLQELAGGQGEIRPIGSIEYFENGVLMTKSYGELNRHGQDSWALPHRSLDWISRDEMGYNKALDAKLFNYSDRTEYQRFMMRASGDDNYPAINDFNHRFSCHTRDEYVHQLSYDGDMKMDIRAVERVIVYLNGDYWGVYGLRERPVDHDYTKEYYDQGKYDLQYVLTWGSTWTEYGGKKAIDDWVEFRDFIMEEDMSDPANYQLVKDQMQVQGLIDYMLINLNVVSSDWMNYNTGWWRGIDPKGDHKKWGYILWDNDATFDYYINYSGVPNISPNAEPCDIEDISNFMDGFFNDPNPPADPALCPTILNGSCPYPPTDSIFITVASNSWWCCENFWSNNCQEQYDEIASGQYRTRGNVGKHEKIFLKMQEENPEFQQHYYSRQADLWNTVFSCENMLTKFDSMVAIIEPEMPRQIARWGGSMTEWQDNLTRMRTFIEERCEFLDDGLVNCYDVTGPYPITLNVEPAGTGFIEWNTLDLTSFPWSGEYFGGMDNLAHAKPMSPDYTFDHWEYTSVNNTLLPDPMTDKAAFTMTEGDELTAVFKMTSSTDDIANLKDLVVAPNPARHETKVQLDLDKPTYMEVSLVSALGQVVKSYPNLGGLLPQGKSQMTLDVTGIPTGMYTVQFKAEHQIRSVQLAVVNN